MGSSHGALPLQEIAGPTINECFARYVEVVADLNELALVILAIFALPFTVAAVLFIPHGFVDGVHLQLMVVGGAAESLHAEQKGC